MSKNRNSNVGIGIAFIIAGVMLFAYQFGYIDLKIFWSLFKLWPLILIVIGINIIFKGNNWIKWFSWIMLIFIIIIYSQFCTIDGRVFWNNTSHVVFQRFRLIFQ